MAFTLHRIAPFIPSATDVDQWADICVSADQCAAICATAAVPAKKRGRPRGPSSQRKPIPLPDGDMLTPLISLFSESTGLHPKTLQRLRHKLPCVDIGGVCYVRDAAARAILQRPQSRAAAGSGNRILAVLTETAAGLHMQPFGQINKR